MKATQYFLATRMRPDRLGIRDEWIEKAITQPIRETRQADGRIRRWARIDEQEGRYLRVVLLGDGERCTTHSSTGVSSHEDQIFR